MSRPQRACPTKLSSCSHHNGPRKEHMSSSAQRSAVPLLHFPFTGSNSTTNPSPHPYFARDNS